MPSLTELSTTPPRRFELKTSTTLGRDAGCTIVLNDALVSRTHAEIKRTPEGQFVLLDLGSTHGTFVDGVRIKQIELHDGHEIIIGATRLRFEQALQRFRHAAVSVSSDAQAQRVKQGAVVSEPVFPVLQDVAHDHEALRNNYEKLHAAYELTRAIGVKDDVDVVLDRIIETAFHTLAADRAAILLRDQQSGQLVARRVRQRDGEAPADDKLVLSQTIINEVVQSKAGLVLLDAGSDVRFGGAQSIVSQGVRSAMCVPFVHSGELLGVMHLDSLMASNVFTEHDLEVFTTLAGQAALVVRNTLLRMQVQEEANTRVNLQRFLSPNVVDQVIGGKYRLGHSGELRDITVLFSDIRGFTAMSEKQSDPATIVELLNEYFERMVDILFRFGGTLDKYVGDELMALFGVPVPLPDAPLRAVECAREMLRELAVFNAEREAQGKFTIAVGIGVHTGRALCGTIGSRKAMQYTAIGDTVNTGSRLCGLAKAGQVIVTEETMAHIGHAVHAEPLNAVHVKGKERMLKVFNVLSLLTAAPTLELPGFSLEE